MLCCCDVVMLWCCDVVMLWCCDVVMLWCCNAVMLWCCDVVMLCSCDVVQRKHKSCFVSELFLPKQAFEVQPPLETTKLSKSRNCIKFDCFKYLFRSANQNSSVKKYTWHHAFPQRLWTFLKVFHNIHVINTIIIIVLYYYYYYYII